MRHFSAIAALLFAPAAVGEERSRYIVELASPPAVERLADSAKGFDRGSDEARRYLSVLEAEQAAVLARAASSMKRSLPVAHRYRMVLNGFAVDLSAGEAAAMAQFPGVLRVSAETFETLHTDAGPAWVGAAEAWAGVPNAAGTRGEGVIVGVIDSGINASHPAFAEVDSAGFRHQNPRPQRYGLCNTIAAARCNNKLIGIYDFTTEAAVDGNDVNGHGTHVAATAIGNVRATSVVGQTASLTLTLSGVAPRANLVVYKACTDDGGSGTCPNSATTAALDQAVVDGVDVINYSIGGPAVDPWPGLTGGSSPSIRAMANVARAGIAIAVSAGNDGPAPGTVGSPANSPWVLAAAAATSNRRIANVLTELSSNGVAPPATRYIGAGLAGGVGPVRIVLGESQGSARCSQGDNLDSPPTGVSNPWTGRVFNGEIVVCDRGVQARVAKGFNVQRAGAGGMVLVNTAADGDSVISDDHFLPATHIGFSDGEQLKAWVRASQGSARGRLTGVQAVLDDSFGDVLASFSARGPDPNITGVLKPNISGPGVNIQAAAHNNNGERTLSGTSMSSPHMAGALALLRSRRAISSGELYSALQLTAAPGSRTQDGVTPATALDVGAGRARVDRALSAGLVMPISMADFDRENPRRGGDPARLNLPNLYRDTCRTRCVFERQFRALRGATYTVADASQGGVTISAVPASFTLSAGQTQSVQFTVDVSAPSVLGRMAHGLVSIRASDSSIPESRLPVVMRSVAGDLPSALTINADADRGRFDAALSNMVPVSAIGYRVHGPVEVRRERPTLVPDNNANPYDSANGTATYFLDLTSPGSLRVEVASSSATDIDLFVGRDDNGDNAVASGEERCQGISPAVAERCLLDEQPAGRYWVRVQNAGGSAAGNLVEIDLAAVPYQEPNPRGHAAGATQIADGAVLPVAVHYDLNGLAVGSRAFAILELRAGRTAAEAFARVPLTFQRNGAAPLATRFLADGVTHSFLLPPAGRHERLAIDVPQGATRLQIEQRGASGNASLYVARAPSIDGPDLAPAPAAADALVAVDGPDSNETINLEAPQLTPGRYYVVARQGGDSALPLSITARISQTPLAPFAAEVYFNPARDGHGLLFTRAGNSMQMVWYTYDGSNQPTWYLAFPDALALGSGQVRADLYRYHWIAGGADGQRIGEVVLVRQGERLMLNWDIDGRSGSEPLQLLASSACVDSAGGPLDPTGLWFEPARSGYGANFFTRPGIDFAVLYVFDGNGAPRWMLGQQAAFNAAPLALSQYTGFCPGCAATAVTQRPAGQLQRSFDAPGQGLSGRWSFLANFQAPLTGQFAADNVAVQLLTGRKLCP